MNPRPPAASAGLDIEIIADAAPWNSLEGLEGQVISAVHAAFAACQKAPCGLIAVLCTDDARMRELNRDFRGKDAATNVLSFPAPPSPAGSWGDIALAYETLAREAAAQAKPLAHHLTHLVVHGTLHLLGFDHETETEADDMEAIEIAALAGLGLPNPYLEIAADDGRRVSP